MIRLWWILNGLKMVPRKQSNWWSYLIQYPKDLKLALHSLLRIQADWTNQPILMMMSTWTQCHQMRMRVTRNRKMRLTRYLPCQLRSLKSLLLKTHRLHSFHLRSIWVHLEKSIVKVMALQLTFWEAPTNQLLARICINLRARIA